MVTCAKVLPFACKCNLFLLRATEKSLPNVQLAPPDEEFYLPKPLSGAMMTAQQ